MPAPASSVPNLRQVAGIQAFCRSDANSAGAVSRHAEAMVERALRERDQAVSATTPFLANDAAAAVRPPGGSDSDEDDDDNANSVLSQIRSLQAKTAPGTKAVAEIGAAEADALDEFNFLDQAGGDAAASKPPGQGEQWGNVNFEAVNKMKEQYKAEARSKKSHSTENLEKEGVGPEAGALPGELEALGLDPNSTDDVDPGADLAGGSEEGDRRTWACRYTLRSHLDGIRAMGFHPVEPLLLTASYDATLKLWNLGKAPGSPSNTAKKPGGAGTGGSGGDMEPVYTFRGHTGPILCLCLSPTGDTCFTGGRDGTIRSWTLPSPNQETYEPYDKKLCGEVLRGHVDAIWSLAFHDSRLLSASSDGSLKVWEPGSPEPLLSSLPAPGGAPDAVPVSVDFVSTEPKQALVAYKARDGSRAYILDIDSGKVLLTFDLGAAASSLVYQIISHPTMPLTIMAFGDAHIRYFDNATGACSEDTVAHLDAVTSLSVDPNGLFLLSGSHDGSLRLWNLETKSCLQEITAHRKKLDEAVLAVAFHPSRPMIASAGADSNAKLFV